MFYSAQRLDQFCLHGVLD